MRSLLARLRRYRRRALVHRRPLAALMAGGAVFVALQAAAAPPPPTVGVWTASHDLAGGTVLSAGDLTRAEFSAQSVPTGTLADPRAAVGRTLAAPLRRGEPVTDLRLVDAGMLEGYPGRAAVPVRITDPGVVGLLRVGDRVSLVASDPQGRAKPVTLATDVPVVAIPARTASRDSSGLPGRLVLVAVHPADAELVAATGLSGVVTAFWNR